MGTSKKQNQFLTGVFCLFNDNVVCLESWGFYLFDDDFNDEPQLRNRLGAIWLASLFDSLHAEIRQVKKYRNASLIRGLNHLPRYCDQAEYFFGTVREIMGKYSKSEQIFIVYLRNQWVHSFLSGRHAEKVGIKFVENDKLKSEQLTRDQYDELVRPHFKKASLDQTLQELVSRAIDQNLEYWTIVGEFQKKRNAFYEAMLSGREFNLDSIPV